MKKVKMDMKQQTTTKPRLSDPNDVDGTTGEGAEDEEEDPHCTCR